MFSTVYPDPDELILYQGNQRVDLDSGPPFNLLVTWKPFCQKTFNQMYYLFDSSA